MQPVSIHVWSSLPERTPTYALVEGVDLVLVRDADAVSVFYGRCLHRGALLADGYVDGQNLICPLHNWDYRIDSGVSEYNNQEAFAKFSAWVEEDQVWVDGDEIRAWAQQHPQPYRARPILVSMPICRVRRKNRTPPMSKSWPNRVHKVWVRTVLWQRWASLVRPCLIGMTFKS